MSKLKIAILGTRGIPNEYGGFEQFAEFLSLGLVKRGHKVWVYNSHKHSYQEPTWNGVNIIHCKDPEHKMGTVGQFIYDKNCVFDSRKRGFDIILQLGYTSSSVWNRYLPKKKSIITTNMDGLEWKRTKFSKPVQKFLQYAEKLAIKHSHHLISDSKGIQSYIKDKYNMDSIYIPYGAHIFESPNENILEEYKLEKFLYHMLVARLEPENSIEIILDGVLKSKTQIPFLVVGKHETKYGEYLKDKYKDPRIRFMGGIYNLEHLNNIRYFSNLYFHGHTVGGTNPSLLEAMASSALICAHENEFNMGVLGDDSYPFKTSEDVAHLLDSYSISSNDNPFIKNNLKKIEQIFTWENIINQYEDHFISIMS